MSASSVVCDCKLVNLMHISAPSTFVRSAARLHIPRTLKHVRLQIAVLLPAIASRSRALTDLQHRVETLGTPLRLVFTRVSSNICRSMESVQEQVRCVGAIAGKNLWGPAQQGRLSLRQERTPAAPSSVLRSRCMP